MEYVAANMFTTLTMNPAENGCKLEGFPPPHDMELVCPKLYVC